MCARLREISKADESEVELPTTRLTQSLTPNHRLLVAFRIGQRKNGLESGGRALDCVETVPESAGRTRPRRYRSPERQRQFDGSALGQERRAQHLALDLGARPIRMLLTAARDEQLACNTAHLQRQCEPLQGRHANWELTIHLSYTRHVMLHRMGLAAGKFPHRLTKPWWPALPSRVDGAAWLDELTLLEALTASKSSDRKLKHADDIRGSMRQHARNQTLTEEHQYSIEYSEH